MYLRGGSPKTNLKPIYIDNYIHKYIHTQKKRRKKKKNVSMNCGFVQGGISHFAFIYNPHHR